MAALLICDITIALTSVFMVAVAANTPELSIGWSGGKYKRAENIDNLPSDKWQHDKTPQNLKEFLHIPPNHQPPMSRANHQLTMSLANPQPPMSRASTHRHRRQYGSHYDKEYAPRQYSQQYNQNNNQNNNRMNRQQKQSDWTRQSNNQMDYFVQATKPRGSAYTLTCYSCMSQYFQHNWNYVSSMYQRPKTFSPACDEQTMDASLLPLKNCSDMCIHMRLTDTVGGRIRMGYLRGCISDILNHNATATRHLTMRTDCSTVSLRSLFMRSKEQSTIADRDLVYLCSCHDNLCNGALSTTRQSIRHHAWLSMAVVSLAASLAAIWVV